MGCHYSTGNGNGLAPVPVSGWPQRVEADIRANIDDGFLALGLRGIIEECAPESLGLAVVAAHAEIRKGMPRRPEGVGACLSYQQIARARARQLLPQKREPLFALTGLTRVGSGSLGECCFRCARYVLRRSVR